MLALTVRVYSKLLPGPLSQCRQVPLKHTCKNVLETDLEDDQGESERRGGSRSGVQTAADELAALKADMVAEAARVKALLDAQVQASLVDSLTFHKRGGC